MGKVSKAKQQRGGGGPHGKNNKKQQRNFNSNDKGAGGKRQHGNFKKKKEKHTWKSVRDKKIKVENLVAAESPSPSKRKSIKQQSSDLGVAASSTESAPSSSSLRSRMLERLSIARFRTLNADIDSRAPSTKSSNPLSRKETFKSYHTGFETASSLWKQNPLDLISGWIIKTVPKEHVVADFGCGSGKLAKSIPNLTHSFDLHALDDHVTECDMSNVPLDDGTVHVVVFCLSLMGNDVTQFLVEARRVLVDGGRVKIAEAAARLSGDNMRKFISGMSNIGFKKTKVQEIGGGQGNTHVFVLMEFKKVGDGNAGRRVKSGAVVLGPCIYKKR